MESHGWTFSHAAGSHHIFIKPGQRSYCVPVHHGEVKYGYYRDVQKINEGK